jgi:hypothetical protein
MLLRYGKTQTGTPGFCFAVVFKLFYFLKLCMMLKQGSSFACAL